MFENVSENLKKEKLRPYAILGGGILGIIDGIASGVPYELVAVPLWSIAAYSGPRKFGFNHDDALFNSAVSTTNFTAGYAAAYTSGRIIRKFLS